MKMIDGDLLAVDRGFILHQVNCLGVMGAGLAKQIKLKFPSVFETYHAVCQQKDPASQLGSILVVPATKDLHVVNLFGQINYGTDRKQTDYEAVRKALYKFVEYKEVFDDNNWPVYVPMGMGCGLAGGDWDVVSSIVEHIIPDATVVRFKKART